RRTPDVRPEEVRPDPERPADAQDGRGRVLLGAAAPARNGHAPDDLRDRAGPLDGLRGLPGRLARPGAVQAVQPGGAAAGRPAGPPQEQRRLARPAPAVASTALATPRIDLADRVAACPLRTVPFHHVYLEEAFAPDVYRRLLAALPDLRRYRELRHREAM